ncbi:MAG TPA: hypothetical protein VKK31_15515 [Thermoanaerobaculia bacterium]|nr:hypothetical protein [Thermoanaerobaculia bacterium]
MAELLVGLLDLVGTVWEAVLPDSRDIRERKAEKLRNMKPHPFDALDERPPEPRYTPPP